MDSEVTVNIWSLVIPGIVGFATLVLQNYTASATAKRNRQWDLEDRNKIAVEAAEERQRHTAGLTSLVTDVGVKADAAFVAGNQSNQKIEKLGLAAAVEAKKASVARHTIVAELARIEVAELARIEQIKEALSASPESKKL
jgi:hypothetical protein